MVNKIDYYKQIESTTVEPPCCVNKPTIQLQVHHSLLLANRNFNLSRIAVWTTLCVARSACCWAVKDKKSCSALTHWAAMSFCSCPALALKATRCSCCVLNAARLVHKCMKGWPATDSFSFYIYTYIHTRAFGAPRGLPPIARYYNSQLRSSLVAPSALPKILE